MNAASFNGIVLAFTLAAPVLVPAATHQGTSAHGEEVLARHQCLSCHRLDGEGEGTASDLARRPMPALYSPAGFAAQIWNHAPQMWAETGVDGLGSGELRQRDADDLFAYLWSNRYFDPRGEAIEGKKIVTSRGCTQCHQMSTAPTGFAEPSFDWAALGDPAVLAQRLWNHSDEMFDGMAANDNDWPELSEADMADLLTYLQNLKSARSQPRTLELTDPEVGRRVFTDKGCVACHERGEKHDLGAGRPRQYRTFSGFAAALWNHTPGMQGEARSAASKVSDLTPDEMRALTSYLYAAGYFEDAGSAARGARIYVRRGCASCHDEGAQHSKLQPGSERRISASGMVAALWQHVPGALGALEDADREWPEHSQRDMADLIAFFNSSRMTAAVGSGPEIHLTRRDGEEVAGSPGTVMVQAADSPESNPSSN